MNLFLLFGLICSSICVSNHLNYYIGYLKESLTIFPWWFDTLILVLNAYNVYKHMV